MQRRGWRSTVSGGGTDTFERFSEPARQVVVLAQDEARAPGHAFIAPEHLLLGLTREAE
ncbi:MAG: Clp protease N-terminal domain-containing protein, partial [Actinomycetota bacterium]